MDTLEPLHLAPNPSRRLWGGERLGRLLEEPTPPGSDPIGEAWLVGADNPITRGALRGRTLQEAADRWGEALVGTAAAERYGGKVPLLVKLIDAAQPLSIQVHPDDAYARAHEPESGHLGKEEAWYVLHAEPGAEIVWGFARDVEPEEVRAAVEGGELEALLRRVPVERNDVIYNPAGRVHAIGGGIFLFEVQQPSDLTYRLYDYGRRDAAGRTRELHLEDALAVADFRGGGEPTVEPRSVDGWTERARSEFFVMDSRSLAEPFSGEVSPASLETLTFVRGRGRVRAEGREWVAFAHDSVVLPASLGAYEVQGEGELVRCRVPATAT